MIMWIWPIESFAGAETLLPKRMVTRRAFDGSGALDPTTALILPSGGVDSLVSQINALDQVTPGDADCLGVWLSRHHQPREDVLHVLAASGFGWVTNFPFFSMFGDQFGRQLSEVGTGAPQEYAALTAMRTAGKKVLLSMTPDIPVNMACGADALLLAIRSAEDLNRVAEGYIEGLKAVYGASVPVIVHGGPDSHLPRAPKELGISGILHMPNSTHGASSDYTASFG